MHGKSSNSSIFLPHSPGAVANVAAEVRSVQPRNSVATPSLLGENTATKKSVRR